LPEIDEMNCRPCLPVIIVLVALACSSPPVTPPPFNGERAYEYLVRQVRFGPRVPGSEAWTECRSFFYEHFSTNGLEVDSQVGSFVDDATGVEYPLVNVIGRFRSGSHDDLPLLLMAHWDSRPRTDFHTFGDSVDQPIDGANDGASGVAVLLELANLLAEQPPDCNVDLVLSDAEDWGEAGHPQQYLLGSKHFAATGSGIRGKYRFGIVIDMIGDAEQTIYRESFSQEFCPEVTDMIWSVAGRLNVATFLDSVRDSILDDHMSLTAAGVPTAVVIDFDYPYWHTEFDTPDKCSPEALANVGQVVAYIVYNRSVWPSL
jgi:hypothetical protein